jgi:hypothetical protein
MYRIGINFVAWEGWWCLGFEDYSGGINGVFDLWDAADVHVLL